jgi:hypothetical protein
VGRQHQGIAATQTGDAEHDRGNRPILQGRTLQVGKDSLDPSSYDGAVDIGCEKSKVDRGVGKPVRILLNESLNEGQESLARL